MCSRPPAEVGPGRLRRWWLDLSVRAKGMIVVAVPLIALVAVTSASLALQYSERQERTVAIAASAVNTSAQQVLADAVNAETGMRGYAATGDPVVLQPYNLALTRLAADRAALRAAAVAQGDSAAERAVAATVTREMAELARLRSTVSAGAPAAVLRPALENGKQTMDALRGQVADLAKGPAAILAARRADISRLESTIGWVSTVGLALGVLAGLMGVALFTSGISRRIDRAAANADRLGEGQPLQPVLGAADELGRLADSLVRAEKLLVRRTAELVTARDEAVTANQAKNAVERILAAGHHLLTLINELIDIARIESGEFSLSVEPVSVSPVVQETCQLMALLAADRSITISQPGPPPGPSPGLAVKADRQRLRQILVNLLSNAIKYNRAGGTVIITCQATSPDQVSLTVADTGPGIAVADLERVFEPFERLGAEQTAVEGTGIGLPLARAFAEAMHGHLTAASVPGEGTTFTITLPRAPDMAWAPAGDGGVPVPRTAPDDLAGESLRILYIEDNPANIEVVARFLRTRPGMRLQSVTSGQAGLEAAAREVPDLILLDLHMPGLHGDEVLRRLRDKSVTAGIPVAILSAEASPAVIRNMRAAGVIAYLTKPLDLTELGQLLDSAAAEYDRRAGLAPGTTSAP
jgi:signal transduction histidine kinase/CheY-like chemotaxis protein